MFEKIKEPGAAQNRGGYRQWYNPVYADPSKNTRLRPTKTNAMLFSQDKGDDEEDYIPREDDDDDNDEKNGKDNDPLQRALTRAPSRAPSLAPSRASRAPSVMPSDHFPPARLRSAGEIQILDLHSDNPIISYKGRIFSGSWAANIGSELLFGAHDEVAGRRLPYLKSLSGGVDLMAASTARIITVPADLRARTTQQTQQPREGSTAPPLEPKHRRQGPDRYRWMRKEAGVEIPVAFDKHGRRRPQARFLENLMAIKHSRGEQDLVTTVTKDTTRDYVDLGDDPEEVSLQRKKVRDRNRQLRLLEEKKTRETKRPRGGNLWAIHRSKVRFATANSAGERSESGEAEGRGVERQTLSMQTPKTWGNDGDSGSQTRDDNRDTAMDTA